MQLALSEPERQELLDLVRAAHRELGSEIHHAQRPYREPFRQRRALLEGLLHRLENKVQAAA